MVNKIIKEIIALRGPSIIAIIITAVVLILLLLFIRNFNLSGKYSRVFGLFVGLRGRSALHLCFTWTKYVYFIAILCSMQVVSYGHYIIIIFLLLASALMGMDFKLIVIEIVGGLLCVASVWVCSVFAEYMINVRSDLYVLSAYWVVTVFMILCATALFLFEVMYISKERESFETNIHQKQNIQ